MKNIITMMLCFMHALSLAECSKEDVSKVGIDYGTL